MDIDEHLAHLATAGQWPDWLIAADAWWDGLELTTRTGTSQEEVKEWLDSAFGAGSTEWREGDALELKLDDPRTSDFTGIRVTSRSQPETAAGHPRIPLLRERQITRQLAEPLARPRDRFADEVQVMAFHSFKGGVGRTVHAVAIA
ncbi:hypothetical protein D7231_35735, partial [Streptomyces klenkii]